MDKDRTADGVDRLNENFAHGSCLDGINYFVDSGRERQKVAANFVHSVVCGSKKSVTQWQLQGVEVHRNAHNRVRNRPRAVAWLAVRNRTVLTPPRCWQFSVDCIRGQNTYGAAGAPYLPPCCLCVKNFGSGASLGPHTGPTLGWSTVVNEARTEACLKCPAGGGLINIKVATLVNEADGNLAVSPVAALHLGCCCC
jgi:hypothetical protein